MILKTGLLPNFESSIYSGWDPDLIRLGACTLTLASLKVCSVILHVIDFCIIINLGLIFYHNFFKKICMLQMHVAFSKIWQSVICSLPAREMFEISLKAPFLIKRDEIHLSHSFV